MQQYQVSLLTLLSFVRLSVSDGGCNFVKFDANLVVDEVGLSHTVGTFSLSTDVCQSLKANAFQTNWFGIDLSLEGSLIMTCDGSSDNDLQIQLFEDFDCTDPIQSYTVSDGESISFYDYFELTMDQIHCDMIDCAVTAAFASNCSWDDSPLYANVSLPPEQCLSLGADISGIIESSDVIPDSVIEYFDTSSMKFSCCQSDDSLLIYNYSDVACDMEVSRIRISSDYNGACFEMVDGYDLFSDDMSGPPNDGSDNGYTSKADSGGIPPPDDTDYIVLRFGWNCASWVDCDGLGIDFLDVSALPLPCTNECESLHDHSDSTNTNSGGSSDGPFYKQQWFILAVISVLALTVVFVCILLYLQRRRQRLQNELQQKQRIGFDKYEPMIEEDSVDDKHFNITAAQPRISAVVTTTAAEIGGETVIPQPMTVDESAATDIDDDMNGQTTTVVTSVVGNDQEAGVGSSAASGEVGTVEN